MEMSATQRSFAAGGDVAIEQGSRRPSVRGVASRPLATMCADQIELMHEPTPPDFGSHDENCRGADR